MTKSTKLFLSTLGIGLASVISVANAAEDTVLFKIHDIVPVKNADGNVIACDVGATFYNRTANEIKNASLNLIWNDEVIGDTINQEERDAKEAQRANRKNTPRYGTSTYNSKAVTLKLRLPPLKSYQQVTLKSKVNTDRCFLLLNDMDIDVTNCGSNTDKSAPRSSFAPAAACDDLFTYVAPKSPEYYNDFQAISAEEQIAQENTVLQAKKEALDNAYTDAVNQVEALSKTLEGN